MGLRILALDVGDRRVGVALSDEMGWTAQPLEVIDRGSAHLDRIIELVSEYQVERIIVGMPYNMDGSSGARVDKTRLFMERLQNRLAVPVESWDERLSTVAAERALLQADVSRARRRQVRDKLAAVFILQGYLDHRRGQAGRGGQDTP